MVRGAGAAHMGKGMTMWRSRPSSVHIANLTPTTIPIGLPKVSTSTGGDPSVLSEPAGNRMAGVVSWFQWDRRFGSKRTLIVARIIFRK